MKILIYGAGAIGGYLGGRLLQQNHDVTLIAREVSAEIINKSGLDISEGGERSHTNPLVLTSVLQAFDQEQQYDLIIMSMKSYDLLPSLDALVAFCPDPAMILAIQNGIGVEQPLIDQYGAERIISGAVTIPISRETTDHIVVEKEDRGLALAPTQPGQNIKQWGLLFKKAGIKTELMNNYQEMKWSKALLNLVGNATSAILNRRPGLIYKSDIVFDLEVRMLKETLAVMKAKKINVIDLPGSGAKRLAFGVQRLPRSMLKPIMTNLVSSGRGDKMPSFQIDLMAGKGKSEVVYHNGAIAQAGQEVGVPTPINAALFDILKRLTMEELDWREFDGRPKRLAVEIKHFQATVNGEQ